MNGLTDEMRAEMQAINANINHTRATKLGARYIRYNGERVVESDRPEGIVGRSMFPYKSTQMAVDPGEVPAVQERLRKEGVFVEFDEEGRPEITSTKQCGKVAEAMGMKTGRDGFGHINEAGQFESTGRKRNDEVQAHREKVRRCKAELESMPEEVHVGAVDSVLDKYDIRPTEENTG